MRFGNPWLLVHSSGAKGIQLPSLADPALFACFLLRRFFCASSIITVWTSAEQVRVRHKEGLVHGFLVLRTLEGGVVADGDLIQNVQGDRVTSRLVFHFKDGSIHDETAVFSQRGYFRLISDHLIQKGPAFEHPIELVLDAVSGQCTVRYNQDGKEKTASEHLQLPNDIANGLTLTLLKNLDPKATETRVGFVATTPKPKLVRLAVTPEGVERFATGDIARRTMDYTVKVEIGGLTGVFAEVLGKKPADTHVWILGGAAPAFIRSEGPFSNGGPIWQHRTGESGVAQPCNGRKTKVMCKVESSFFFRKAR